MSGSPNEPETQAALRQARADEDQVQGHSASPRELLKAVQDRGESLVALAQRAGIAPRTVYTVRRENCWPKQRRVRIALQRALGLLDGQSQGGAA